MTVKFIADVGANHNKDLDRVERLIKDAKTIGCDAVKFQLYKAERLYAPEFADKVEAARAGELPISFVPAIAEICRHAKIEFHCTPFHVDDVYVLRAWVDALKIASYSILDLKLVKAASGQGLPLGISTGGATAAEIGEAYDAARENLPAEQVTLYHCIPEYPAELRAGMMQDLRTCCRAYSDHTRRIEAVLAAIAAGAKVIEFHIDLNDHAGVESAAGHCRTAGEAHAMIIRARTFDRILHDKYVEPDYMEMRRWRADPFDEMRPKGEWRAELRNK